MRILFKCDHVILWGLSDRSSLLRHLEDIYTHPQPRPIFLIRLSTPLSKHSKEKSEEHLPFESEAIPLRGPLDEKEREKAERDKRQDEYKKHDEEHKSRQVEIAKGQLSAARKMVDVTIAVLFCGIIGSAVALYQATVTKISAEAARSASITAVETLGHMKTSGEETKAQIDRLIAQQQRTAEAIERSLDRAKEAMEVHSPKTDSRCNWTNVHTGSRGTLRSTRQSPGQH